MPEGVLLVVLNHLRSVGIGSRNGNCLNISPSASDYCQYLFDKNKVWVHHNASASEFISVVLIRTLPGTLSRHILPWLCLYCFASWCLPLRVIPLNGFTQIISGAAFRIIALTKTPKIEFLPLDWVYCSIRIMTVCAL